MQTHQALITVIKRVADIILIFVTALLAFKIRFNGQYHLNTNYQVAILLACVVGFLIFTAFGRHDASREPSVGRTIQKTFTAWLLLSLILSLFAFATQTGGHFSRLWLFQWMFLGFGFSMLSRVAYHLVLASMHRRGKGLRKLLLMTRSGSSFSVLERLKANRSYGYRAAEIIDLDASSVPENLSRYVREKGFDEVWLALPSSDQVITSELLTQLRYSSRTIRIVPDLLSMPLINYSAANIAGIPVLNIRANPITGSDVFIKNFEDYFLATLIIVLLSPVYLILALMVKLSSKGPVIFKQSRYGFDGEIIKVYKFRSMKLHSEQAGQVTQATREDERLTKIGKFMRRTSLDELPQFFNVLQGRMSIVGPRPHAVSHNEEFKDKVDRYMQRHMVKPGVTGWAQVNGFRGETDTLDKMKNRVQYDLYYIENWSLWFDLKIILMTIPAAISSENAY